ncbi:craniofacial development protein 2-like [Schistocerca piceifrons]|uniref:craniofacial development protein 2-like n=1 Tax=Schistocerca piceifrons TaxID=274613 RepID=UPI001F5FDF49|nr:craniofacial development protein 2-like [Schistocerca piceifrons]
MMQRRKIKSLCVQETRCKGNKAKILAEGYKLLYSSESPESRNGVGVNLHRKLQEEVCEVNKVNDTVMYVKMMFGREMVTVLTAYASEAGCSEDEKEKFWRDLDGVMVGVPENERVIVGGDLNGHVGGRKGGEERWHGGGGYGERNEEGKKIVEFAVAFDLVIMNTYFQRKREKLITYRSDENISQIDYILCRRKYGGEVRNTNVI